nr:hypothetical protein [Tanacetum cinerariifolium]
MRRARKGFSGVETPLFENMLEDREVNAEEEVQVPAQDDVAQENVTEEIADAVAQPASPLPPSPQVLDKCSALVIRVEGLETANTAQQLEIIKLKARVKKLERLNKVVAVSTPISAAKPKVLKIAAALAVSTKKRKGVIIRDPKEELHDDTPAET